MSLLRRAFPFAVLLAAGFALAAPQDSVEEAIFRFTGGLDDWPGGGSSVSLSNSFYVELGCKLWMSLPTGNVYSVDRVSIRGDVSYSYRVDYNVVVADRFPIAFETEDFDLSSVGGSQVTVIPKGSPPNYWDHDVYAISLGVKDKTFVTPLGSRFGMTYAPALFMLVTLPDSGFIEAAALGHCAIRLPPPYDDYSIFDPVTFYAEDLPFYVRYLDADDPSRPVADAVAGSVFTVASLTSDGRERWVYRNRGAGVGMGGAHSVIWGGDGNVYAAGSCLDSASLPQFTVVSLTTDGVERWVYQYRDPAYLWGMAGRIAWGTDGQLYAAGESYDTSFSDYFTVVSLTASGTERWVYRYGEPGLAANMAMSVVVGHDGSVYVAGSIPDSAYMDFAVIGLTSAGGERWVYRLQGTADGPGLAYSLAAGSDRNIYAAGMTFGGPYGTDFTVASLTEAGGERWVYRHARLTDSAEAAGSVVWGTDGNVYAAGSCWSAGSGDDFTVISLTPSGSERWVRCYDGPAHGEDGASSIAYGADGYLYAAGSSTGIGTQHDITVAKMDATSGVAEVFGGARPAGHLGTTVVKSRLCLDRTEPAQLLDAVGRSAALLRPGANDIRHLAPGVYFCRLQAGGADRTVKLVVQR